MRAFNDRLSIWVYDHSLLIYGTILALGAVAICFAVWIDDSNDSHGPTFCTYTLTSNGGPVTTWALADGRQGDRSQILQNGGAVTLPVPPSDMTCSVDLGNTPAAAQIIGLHDTPLTDGAS